MLREKATSRENSIALYEAGFEAKTFCAYYIGNDFLMFNMTKFEHYDPNAAIKNYDSYDLETWIKDNLDESKALDYECWGVFKGTELAFKGMGFDSSGAAVYLEGPWDDHQSYEAPRLQDAMAKAILAVIEARKEALEQEPED